MADFRIVEHSDGQIESINVDLLRDIAFPILTEDKGIRKKWYVRATGDGRYYEFYFEENQYERAMEIVKILTKPKAAEEHMSNSNYNSVISARAELSTLREAYNTLYRDYDCLNGRYKSQIEKNGILANRLARIGQVGDKYNFSARSIKWNDDRNLYIAAEEALINVRKILNEKG